MESLPLISAAFSAIGTLAQAGAQRDAANYNARLADQQATATRQQGAEEEAQLRRANAARMGLMKAGYGASGVALEGSPLDVLESSAAQMELDAQNLRYNASVKALGYSNSAALDRQRGENAWSSGMFRAAGQSLLAYQDFGKGTGTRIPDYYPRGNNPDEY